jgi:hypothetical protein
MHIAGTVLAVGQQWVAHGMRFWPQDEYQTMFATSVLKHIGVLSKSEGRRSGWHPAVQMCMELLVQLMSASLRSHRQTKMKM